MGQKEKPWGPLGFGFSFLLPLGFFGVAFFDPQPYYSREVFLAIQLYIHKSRLTKTALRGALPNTKSMRRSGGKLKVIETPSLVTWEKAK